MKILKRIQIKNVAILLLTTLFFVSCNQDFNEIPIETENKNLERLVGEAIMNVSYDVKTSRDFETLPLDFSPLDLSYMNPSNEKQRVTMELLESGVINMIIEKIAFESEIKMPHRTAPDDMPQISKTEIYGSTANFYDDKGNLLNTTHIDIPNHTETVQKIKELGNDYTMEEINNTIATMQGHLFIDNLNEFIEDAPKQGIQVVEQGESYVTLRMPMSNIDPNMQEDVVLLIDKVLNKMVGTRIYSADDKLLQSTYFGYNDGQQKYLNAIKQEVSIILPSGKEVLMTSLSKIDNFKFDLNI
jgi:hypothetical protein